MGAERCLSPSCSDRRLPTTATRSLLVEGADAIGPPGIVFPERSWGVDAFALVILAEFLQTQWQGIVIHPPPAGEEVAEIAELRRLAKERSGTQEETAAQNSGLVPYFERLLMTTPTSNPGTSTIIQSCVRISELVVVHFKRKFNRARPQQFAPDLASQIVIPKTPSYPGGYATTSTLIALSLASIIPGYYHGAVSKLAEQIGKNREREGLNFPSDTLQGVELAKRIFPYVQQLAIYKDKAAQAQSEWTPTVGTIVR